MKNYRIILASSSPRRIEILRQNQIEPIIIHPTAEESLDKGISPEDAVVELALRKAKSVLDLLTLDPPLQKIEDPILIIGADTIVYSDRIIGKPKNKEDAFNILKYLCGKEHFVATGVALLDLNTKREKTFYEITKVGFKKYKDDDILSYIETEEPYDKAGGYAIQGGWKDQIEYIEGDYNNVVGFPWDRIKTEIESF